MAEHLDLICPACEVRYKNEPIYNCKKCGYPLMSVEAYNRVVFIAKREVYRRLRDQPAPVRTKSENPSRSLIVIMGLALLISIWLGIYVAVLEPARPRTQSSPPALTPLTPQGRTPSPRASSVPKPTIKSLRLAPVDGLPDVEYADKQAREFRRYGNNRKRQY